MSDDLSGDIVIDDLAVRFSDNVGSVVNNEQIAVLYRTAERLGKVAVCDRYPTDPVLRRGIEISPKGYAGRNEHGVPIDYITRSITIQLERMGRI